MDTLIYAAVITSPLLVAIAIGLAELAARRVVRIKRRARWDMTGGLRR